MTHPPCFPLQVSELFGGMEVCAVSVVVGKDGREHIISACDSTFALIGDSQEEDRRQIADLVSGRMQVSLVTYGRDCVPVLNNTFPTFAERLPTQHDADWQIATTIAGLVACRESRG